MLFCLPADELPVIHCNMRPPLFGTLSQLARFRGVDVRNRQLRELSPAAFLLAGGKKFALFELSDVAETSDLTNRIPIPPKPIL
jgi:hypothetical protein